jgi:hypothetical protein
MVRDWFDDWVGSILTLNDRIMSDFVKTVCAYKET